MKIIDLSIPIEHGLPSDPPGGIPQIRYSSNKDTAEGMFKGFLNRLEESNRGRFDVAKWQMYCDERQLVGLEVGLVFGKELYTSEKGEDKERTVVSYVCASQDIRNGDFKVPELKDRREKVSASTAAAPAAGSYYDNSPVPFS